MSSGATYLAAAYVVVLFTLLVYVGIITAKLARFGRQIAELRAQEDARTSNMERAAA
jgi:hypothetical protein